MSEQVTAIPETPHHLQMSRELERLCLWYTARQVLGGDWQALHDGLAHVRRELPKDEAGLEDQEHRWALRQFGEGTVGRGALCNLRLHVAHMRSFIALWSHRLERAA